MRATNTALTLCLCALLSAGCKKGVRSASANDARQFRDTELRLESCSADDAELVDLNGDGVPEIVRVRSAGVEMCRAVDLNFDGKVDRTAFFEPSGALRRTQSDFDRDGVVDEIVLYQSGVVLEKRRVTTMDGKLDTWEFFQDGKLTRTERDGNGDGFIDQWWEYPEPGCPLIHVDLDGDGRPNHGASIDYCKETGYVPPAIHEEDEQPTQGADFGRSQDDVEEVSNVEVGEVDGAAASPSEPSEVPGGNP